MTTKKWRPKDLLPEGDRVAPQAIADGFMTEEVIVFEGRVRYLAGITEKGVAEISRWADVVVHRLEARERKGPR